MIFDVFLQVAVSGFIYLCLIFGEIPNKGTL